MGAKPTATWKAYGRDLLIFLVAAAGLAVLSGRQLSAPSRDNHFVVMAQGWLEGRLALPGKPPGWCDARARAQGHCRTHRYDDWAVVSTLELDDGRVLRGFPCRTTACGQARRERQVDTWWVVGEGWVELPRGAVTRRHDTWYVSFPPGPAVVLLPAVAWFGLQTPDVLLTLLLGALIPVVLVRILDRERGTDEGRDRQHLWAATAWTFASPATLLAANGRVWFTAQIFGALFVLLYVGCAWRLRRPMQAGLWLALAIACRPINHLPAGLIFLWFWWTHGRDGRTLLRFALPLVVAGVSLAAFNVARFADPFEFGHRFLDVRWQARMQEFGLFHWQYLGRNLQCLVSLLPQVQASAPWMRVSMHGTALWFGSPWLLALGMARRAYPGRGALWCAVVLSALPSLFYQNSGQLQFSYRFAVDWLPMVVLALGFGGGLRTRTFRALVLAGAVIQCTGAWYFARAPGRLFVTDPVGWPFEAEFAESRGRVSETRP